MTLPMPETDTTLPEPPPAPAAVPESFVINLCSSTTPMALTQPQLAELKRYRFFVSRRLEDGRERFRLHMGYFDSLLQAEELLPVVRDIYPGAWAGEAPGKRLRTRATAVPTLTAAPAATPDAAIRSRAPTLRPEPAPAPAPAPAAASAPAPAPATIVSAPTPVLELELVPDPPAPAVVAAPGVGLPPASASASASASAPVAAVSVAPKPAKATSRAGTAKRGSTLPFNQRSNVREVLKSLDETVRTLKPTAKPALPAGPAAREPGVLPESQVMRLLEEKRGDPLNTTSTPAAFAIQLQWSVQRIDLAQVPPLAIFGAYTLYTVEGSREGRKWFGLRLGFFSDANAAKAVAQYVRSEFAAVAVVPVSLRERDGANAAQGGPNAAASGAAPVTAPATIERLPEQSAEFKLLDDAPETPPAPVAAATVSPGRPRTVKGRGNRVHAAAKRSPKTLEQTLEILGADQLQIEGAKKKPVSEGPVRHLNVKVQKNSAFSRLLDRLAERGR